MASWDTQRYSVRAIIYSEIHTGRHVNPNFFMGNPLQRVQSFHKTPIPTGPGFGEQTTTDF